MAKQTDDKALATKRTKSSARAGAQKKPQKPRRRAQAKNLIFALDIGTRSVIGVVGEQLEGERFVVKDYEIMEHSGRAMVDGQVEDIAQVGELIVKVRSRLEERLGMSLTRVSIAAAGRMLRTAHVQVSRELPQPRTQVDKNMVLGLEGEAIELAQEQIRQEQAQSPAKNEEYYCVGYSIVEYRMDGQPIAQLVGHSCLEIGVELIAAFLPYSVVEGLYAAVDISRLEVTNLTLEPIAAFNVLIPRELRLLNLALVDIGAGTSDIAICREGRIVSYDMATIAGDELTEVIEAKYLVDFPTAERIKRSLSSGEEVLEYENILGMPYTLEAKAVLEVLKPTIALLANTIAEKILLINGCPPAAVFLIGGGSQIPGLNQAVAQSLEISADNVAVGSRRSLKGIDTQAFPALLGPEFVTPLGIALTSIVQQGFQFFGVTVNGRKLKLLNATHTRLMDVLLMAGFKAWQIIARSGRSLMFTLNGVPRTIRGGLPEHAIVTVNGIPASIESDIRPGDVILATPARDGAPASAIVLDFLPQEGHFEILVNGEPAQPDTPIAQGDRVSILPRARMPEQGASPTLPKVHSAVAQEPLIKATEQAAAMQAMPVTYTQGTPAPIAPQVYAQSVPASTVAPNQAPIEPANAKDAQAQTEDAPPQIAALGTHIDITLNGKRMRLPLRADQSVYYMMHLLELAGIDASNPKGELVMECDGASVGFMHPILNGSRVRIGWA